MKKEFLLPREEIERQYEYIEKVKPLVIGKKAHVVTFGCQQNEADSERLAGMAEAMGYTVTDNIENADLIIINTCAVREHAELKALSITGQFKHLKEKNPSLVIAIGGCMVSQEHRKDDVKYKYPYVNFIFGTSMLYRFPEELYTCLTEKKRRFWLDTDDEGNITEGLPVRRESSFKAYVSIMYGCNNFCSYCIVPYVRGRERSRRKEDILSEIEALAKCGYKEITLLGQNVNSYGKDLYKSYNFAALLSDVCKIEGDFIVRFMTSHPKDASKELIDVMAENEKIAKHLHLPVQSGSDRILGKMNRRYTTDKYLELLSYAKEKMPDLTVTTDIIVGFPSETEEDFLGTLEVMRKVEYDNIYSFVYSKRVGTPAASMDEQIPDKIKKERMSRLLALATEICSKKNSEYENKTIKVLVEGVSKTDENKLTGRSESNRLVHFEGDSSLIGSLVSVKITKAEAHALFGELEN